jgi:uncharacterized membrane protein
MENRQNLEPEAPDNPAPSKTKLIDMQVRAELHAGPLPPPSVMAEYERIMPGASDRIFVIAEKNQQASIENRSRVIGIHERKERSNSIFANCGQIFGFVTVVMFFMLLGVSMWLDSGWMFTLLFGAGAFAGLARLVRSFQSKDENRGEKP